MLYEIMCLLTVVLPLILGLIVGRLLENEKRKPAFVLSLFGVLVELLNVMAIRFGGFGDGTSIMLTRNASLYMYQDDLSFLLSSLFTTVWGVVTVFAYSYMKGEEKEARFFRWFFITLGAVIGICHSGNLITFYLFYEMMTLVSVPLVLHEETREAQFAAKKYLFYSVAGAAMVLASFFLIQNEGDLSTFVKGGILDSAEGSAKIYIAAMLLILGFGTKAGMWPMHGWLPTAHPVAPSPASAVLSGIITKMGVLGIIRGTYYVFGVRLLRGTWVQYVFIGLTLLTITMGSALAYHEKVMKKRLAYSSVSQVSYCLLGVALFNRYAFMGAILHIIFHCIIKNGLFIGAGSVIKCTGITKCSDLKGLGKKMPVLFACMFAYALSLVGIPPFSGTISKWYLLNGCLEAGIGGWGYVGVGVLILSAILTAGYLFSMCIGGFYGESENPEEVIVTPVMMKIPLIIFAVATLALGIFFSFIQ